jgi:hypothetical protein
MSSTSLVERNTVDVFEQTAELSAVNKNSKMVIKYSNYPSVRGFLET